MDGGASSALLSKNTSLIINQPISKSGLKDMRQQVSSQKQVKAESQSALRKNTVESKINESDDDFYQNHSLNFGTETIERD